MSSISLNEILAVVAVILIIADIFFSSDLLTLVAYCLLCAVFARVLPFHLIYQILCALILWFGLVALHYTLWKRVIQRIVNQVIAPDKIASGAKSLIGQIGEVKEIEGIRMVEVNGDLWKYDDTIEIKCGDKVKVDSEDKGVLHVSVTKKGSQ